MEEKNPLFEALDGAEMAVEPVVVCAGPLGATAVTTLQYPSVFRGSV